MKQRILLILLFLFSLSEINIIAQGIWIPKADFGGMKRRGAVGFAIGSKGYITTGRDDVTFYQVFWEFDPAIIPPPDSRAASKSNHEKHLR